MKTSIIALFIVLAFASCKYDSYVSSSGLSGRWNVSSDFYYDGVGLGNHAVTYAGQLGDYFNFSSNGMLYTKEGSTLDTLSYQFLQGSVSIDRNVYQIENSSSYSVTLYWPGEVTPGGQFSRKIVLTR
ncbi:MAG: hypothetical protein QM734_16700 [Cyclobacteriaceae bacterium]